MKLTCLNAKSMYHLRWIFPAYTHGIKGDEGILIGFSHLIIQRNYCAHLNMPKLRDILSLITGSVPEEVVDMLEHYSIYRISWLNIAFSVVMGLGCILCTLLRSKTISRKQVVLREGAVVKENKNDMESSSDGMDILLNVVGAIFSANAIMMAIMLGAYHLGVNKRECIKFHIAMMKSLLNFLLLVGSLAVLHKKNVLKPIARVIFGSPSKRIIDVLEQYKMRYSLAVWSIFSVAMGCVCYLYRQARCATGNTLGNSRGNTGSNECGGIIKILLFSLLEFFITNPLFLVALLIFDRRTERSRRERLSFCVTLLRAYFFFHLVIKCM